MKTSNVVLTVVGALFLVCGIYAFFLPGFTAITYAGLAVELVGILMIAHGLQK